MFSHSNSDFEKPKTEIIMQYAMIIVLATNLQLRYDFNVWFFITQTFFTKYLYWLSLNLYILLFLVGIQNDFKEPNISRIIIKDYMK